MKHLFYTAQDVVRMLGVSRSKAYNIIRSLNEQLEEKGYLTIRGKVSKVYFQEQCYGGEMLGKDMECM